MSLFRKLAAGLFGLFGGLIGGLSKAVWEAVTRRNLDAEAAEREHAEDQRLKAETAQAELESRHEETLAAAATQAAELRVMRRELAAMAERRERHLAYGRAHQDAAEVRSSKGESDPEPESGAPLAPAPACCGGTDQRKKEGVTCEGGALPR